MNHLKRILTGGLAALALSAGAVTALAAPLYQTPAEAAAGVTGKTLEEVTAERQSGKCYGTIAAEAGALEEFQGAVLEIHEAALAANVEAGLLTQEQADTRLDRIRQRQAVCDGTGGCGLGAGQGQGCGLGLGAGQGCGRGMGMGRGRGMGRGMGRGANGSCPFLTD